MTHSEIKKFIQQNDPSKCAEYFDDLKENLKDTNSQIDKLSIYLIVSALIYFVIPTQKDTPLSIGPINISNSATVYALIPAFFAFVFLRLAMLFSYKGDILKLLKVLATHIYRQEVDNSYFSDPHKFNYITAAILPFSFWSELSNRLRDGMTPKQGCLTLIIVLPSFLVFGLPFYFEFLAVKTLIITYWSDWLAKISVFVSIWLILTSVYMYFKVMSKNKSILDKEANV